MRNRALILNFEELASAAYAWQSGGSLALGAWAARHMPHFSVAEYGALVREVRDYLGDDTDYSDPKEARP
jgi:hypothetical protein